MTRKFLQGGNRCGGCAIGEYCLEVRDEQQIGEGTCMSREFQILFFNCIK